MQITKKRLFFSYIFLRYFLLVLLIINLYFDILNNEIIFIHLTKETLQWISKIGKVLKAEPGRNKLM